MNDPRRTVCEACGTSYADAALRGLAPCGWGRLDGAVVQGLRCLCGAEGAASILLVERADLGDDVVLVSDDGDSDRPVRLVERGVGRVRADDGAWYRLCPLWAPSMRPGPDGFALVRDYAVGEELARMRSWLDAAGSPS